MIVQRDVTDVGPIADQPHATGIVLRHRGRVVGFALHDPATDDRHAQDAFDDALGLHRLAALVRDRLPLATPETTHTFTVAICTRDRPERLCRLLDALGELPATRDERLRVLVVDNAPSTDATRHLVADRGGVDYVVEPRPGLDFARNAALAACTTSVLAYLDDDVVIDPGWFDGLVHAWSHNPGIGGVTGLVMPLALEPEARLEFERHGGFRRGPRPLRFGARVAGAPLHPSGAGSMGAGCNMAFDVELLRRLGGFDPALDTGRPLPGGGDLDIFYRVARSGSGLVYEPSCAVYHEHRETMDELRHQYFTWGLGLFAFLAKVSRTDPANRRQQRRLRRWWVSTTLREAVSAARGHGRPLRMVAAELQGAVKGAFGEYRRSQARAAAIERAHR